MVVNANDVDLRRRFLFRPCDTKEELRNWIISYLGLDMPSSIVDEESTSTPMGMIWEVYSKARQNDDPDFHRVLYFACRDGFKTLGAAILEVLMILHLNRDVAHMAAIEQQAQKAQTYVKGFFRKPYLRDFVEGDNLRETKITRFYNANTEHSLTRSEYDNLTKDKKEQHEEISRALTEYEDREQYIRVILCTMRSANSEHVPFFCVDEVDVVANPTAYEEAKNIPAARDGKLAITMLTSTRKFAFGLVQKEIDEKQKTGLLVRHWNLIDITEACPEERHRPDLPRLPIYRSDDSLQAIDEGTYDALPGGQNKDTYIKDEGYHGCLNNCKLFAVCKGRLATHQKSKSPLLKPISETINRFRVNELSMAKAQLLSRKPSSEGLIYARFDRVKHVLSPAQAYEKLFGEEPDMPKRYTKAMLMMAMAEREVRWYAGIDFGFSHNFVYVQGFRDGNRMFVTHCESAPELEPDQMVDLIEPYKQFAAMAYPDKENPQLIRVLKKNGWKMSNWKKRPGSVAGGITIVQMKLNPTMGAPELFFIHDINEDPGMDLLVQHTAEYHWKRDAAGRPMKIPAEEGDDEPDALRYMVMNVFDPKGKLSISPRDVIPQVVTHPMDGAGTQIYDRKYWMQQIIAERTGQDPGTIGGDSYSYYDEENGGDGQDPDQKMGKQGRRGKLTWDIG